MSDEPANIHHLSLVPVQIEDSEENKWCRHIHVTFKVSKEDRTCRCGSCGREVDPYFALETLASMWDKWRVRAEHAKAVAVGAEDRLRELLRQEKNAKARLRKISR